MKALISIQQKSSNWMRNLVVSESNSAHIDNVYTDRKFWFSRHTTLSIRLRLLSLEKSTRKCTLSKARRNHYTIFWMATLANLLFWIILPPALSLSPAAFSFLDDSPIIKRAKNEQKKSRLLSLSLSGVIDVQWRVIDSSSHTILCKTVYPKYQKIAIYNKFVPSSSFSFFQDSICWPKEHK